MGTDEKVWQWCAFLPTSKSVSFVGLRSKVQRLQIEILIIYTQKNNHLLNLFW